jgi:hypothetical protein
MRYRSRVNPFVVALFLLTASLSNAQEKTRTVEKGLQYQNPPIEVIGRELGDKPFTDDTRVAANRDWLKDLVLVVKNVSNKNIISFDIDLLVKQNGKVLMGIPVNFRTYTRPTKLNARTSSGELKIGVIRPGEVVKVKVTDRALSVFGNELLKRGIEDLDQVTIDLRFVYFDNHTRWLLGQEAPDPDSGKSGFFDKSEHIIKQPFAKLRPYLYPRISGCASI